MHEQREQQRKKFEADVKAFNQWQQQYCAPVGDTRERRLHDLRMSLLFISCFSVFVYWLLRVNAYYAWVQIFLSFLLLFNRSHLSLNPTFIIRVQIYDITTLLSRTPGYKLPDITPSCEPPILLEQNPLTPYGKAPIDMRIFRWVCFRRISSTVVLLLNKW